MYQKRIENTITKQKDGTYTLLTKRIFVPPKGSKVNFRQTEVDAINCSVTLYGVPPAHRDLKAIYEEALTHYNAVMKPYRKMRRRINRRNRKVA